MVQRKCKSNTIKLACIAVVQPFLSKDTRNKIVEVKVDSFPASCQKKFEGRNSFSGAIHDGEEELLSSYPCGLANDQRIAYLPEEPKLSGVEATDREVGGPMLSLIMRIESSLFEFLSVKTLSKRFNGCRNFFSMRLDRIFVPMSAEPNFV